MLRDTTGLCHLGGVSQNSDTSAEEQRGSAKPRRGRPFQPGQSGNPGGRPKGDLARLVRERTQDGKRLVDFWFDVLDNKVPGLEGEARVSDMQRASEVLAERGWGKAQQSVEHAGIEGGAPVVVEVVTLAKGGG